MRRTTNIGHGDDSPLGASVSEPWALRPLVRRHPRIAAGTALLVAALVAVTLLTTVVNPHRAALSDAASCSQWSAATAAQQTAYSHLYINEYGRLANTAAHAAEVRVQIDQACSHAAYLGESEEVTIIAGLRHAF